MQQSPGKFNRQAKRMKRACRFLCATLTATALFFIPLSAGAETQVKKSISYFQIGGRTADDLDKELSRHGPLTQSTGARHPGATEIKFGGEISYTEKGGQCSIGKVKVTLNTKILLPRWTNRKRANAELALIWDTLSADIKRHEERHAEIARGYARELEGKLKALRPQRDCDILQQQVAATSRDVMAAHDKDQLRFDKVESKNFDTRMMRLLYHRLQANGRNR
jgi:predicted secreted Zn-dependent protease